MNQRAGFFIPPLYLLVGYQGAVIVIHRPEHHWIAVEGEDILSGEKGPFIVGSWDFRTNGLALYTPPAVRDSTVPEIQLIYVQTNAWRVYFALNEADDLLVQ